MTTDYYVNDVINKIDANIDAERYIKAIISMFDTVIAKYEQNEQDIKLIEDVQCDINHEASLGKKRDVIKGYKFYNETRIILKKRYELKDNNHLSKDLYDYCKNNIQLKKEFSKMLTHYNKQKKYLENRKYTPRILHDLTMTQTENDESNPFYTALQEVAR
jgi:hypothetical protein